MPRRPTLPLLLTLALLGAAAVPAGATAALAVHLQTASLGPVTETLSYRAADETQWADVRITVTRSGTVAYDAPATPPGCEAATCGPFSTTDDDAVKVVDLDGDGEPEALADLYTGGAHCCLVTEVLRWTGSAYVATGRNFADVGYTLQPATAPGQPATFVTGDDRFAYAFASYADSRFPVQLLTFTAGRWHDVTRAHPATLRAEARRLMAAYHRRRSGKRALGVLAAWVADEWRLGRRAAASRFLAHELHAGRLRSDAPWPAGRRYIRSLTRSLRAWGYGR